MENTLESGGIGNRTKRIYGKYLKIDWIENGDI
jgi:hypothetical protein